MQNKKTFTKPLAVIHQADYKGEKGGLNLLLVDIPKTHMAKEKVTPARFLCPSSARCDMYAHMHTHRHTE